MRFVKASERLSEKKGRYHAKYRSEWDGKIINATIEFNKFWHIRKGDEVIEWLNETEDDQYELWKEVEEVSCTWIILAS